MFVDNTYICLEDKDQKNFMANTVVLNIKTQTFMAAYGKKTYFKL